MQSATLSPARSHGPSKHNLLASVALSAVLLCFSLPNAYSATHLTLTGNFVPAQVGIKYNVAVAASGGTAP